LLTTILPPLSCSFLEGCFCLHIFSNSKLTCSRSTTAVLSPSITVLHTYYTEADSSRHSPLYCYYVQAVSAEIYLKVVLPILIINYDDHRQSFQESPSPTLCWGTDQVQDLVDEVQGICYYQELQLLKTLMPRCPLRRKQRNNEIYLRSHASQWHFRTMRSSTWWSNHKPRTGHLAGLTSLSMSSSRSID
jgi:hypothetical protein